MYNSRDSADPAPDVDMNDLENTSPRMPILRAYLSVATATRGR